MYVMAAYQLRVISTMAVAWTKSLKRGFTVVMHRVSAL